MTDMGSGREPRFSEDRQWRWIGNAMRYGTSAGLRALGWLAIKATEQDKKVRARSINAWKEAAAADAEQNEKLREQDEAEKELAAMAPGAAPVSKVETTDSPWPIDPKTGEPVSARRNPTAYEAAMKSSAIAAAAVVAAEPGAEHVLATTRERLGCVFWFGVVITLGIWLLSLPWWAARSYTLTDRRVIVRRGIFWKSENSIPIRNIQDVSVTYGPLAGTVTVVSAGGAIIFPPIPVAAARKFADAFQRAQK